MKSFLIRIICVLTVVAMLASLAVVDLFADEEKYKTWAGEYGTETVYTSGDVIPIAQYQVLKLYFDIENYDGTYIPAWDSGALRDKGFDVPADPEFRDNYALLVIRPVNVEAGSLVDFTVEWVKADDVFGENPVGFENAERYSSDVFTLRVDIGTRMTVTEYGGTYKDFSESTVKLKQNEKAYYSFDLEYYSDDVILIPGFDTQPLKDAGFTDADNIETFPVEGEDREIACMTAYPKDVEVGTTVTLRVYWVKLSDIFGPEAVGWENATRLCEYDVTFEVVASGAGDDIKPGDVNGDGVINARDVTTLMKVLVGKTVTKYYENAADYNGDKKINARDVVALMTIIVKG